MDKPYGKWAEFFYGRASCALAYSLRNRADRWVSDATVPGETIYHLKNSKAELTLAIHSGASGLKLHKNSSGSTLWRPSFFGSLLVWAAVKDWLKNNVEKPPSRDDEVMCRLALSE
jgi:hypothetical protein